MLNFFFNSIIIILIFLIIIGVCVCVWVFFRFRAFLSIGEDLFTFNWLYYSFFIHFKKKIFILVFYSIALLFLYDTRLLLACMLACVFVGSKLFLKITKKKRVRWPIIFLFIFSHCIYETQLKKTYNEPIIITELF